MQARLALGPRPPQTAGHMLIRRCHACGSAHAGTIAPASRCGACGTPLDDPLAAELPLPGEHLHAACLPIAPESATDPPTDLAIAQEDESSETITVQARRRRKNRSLERAPSASLDADAPPDPDTHQDADPKAVRFLPPQRHLELPRFGRKEVILAPEARLAQGVPSLLPDGAATANPSAAARRQRSVSTIAAAGLKSAMALTLCGLLLFQWLLHDPARIDAAPPPMADLAIRACVQLPCERYPQQRGTALQPAGTGWQWDPTADAAPRLLLAGVLNNPHAITLESPLGTLVIVDRQGHSVALLHPPKPRMRLEPDGTGHWEVRMAFEREKSHASDTTPSASRQRLEAGVAGIQWED